MNKYQHTPETIIEVLKSIKKIDIDGGQLDVYISEDNYPSSKSEYMPGSFTRELLELIEKFL